MNVILRFLGGWHVCAAALPLERILNTELGHVRHVRLQNVFDSNLELASQHRAERDKQDLQHLLSNPTTQQAPLARTRTPPSTEFKHKLDRDASIHPLHLEPKLTLSQVSIEKATSDDPSFAYAAGPATQGLSWYVTFAPTAGDASSLVVSTGNGPESVLASAGTLTGTDPFVRVVEVVKGGLPTSMVRCCS